MKLLCVIDSLGSGGAQRQMINLACGLKSKGYQVELLLYFPQYDFFRAQIDNAEIMVHKITKGKGFSMVVLLRLCREFYKGEYGTVISFLQINNFYCELAKLLTLSQTPLITSERCSSIGNKGVTKQKLFRLAHIMSNIVVANSHHHAQWLRRYFWLKKKTLTIYNGYDIPDSIKTPCFEKNIFYDYLVVGRISPQKNGICLLEALVYYYKKHGKVPKLAWAGRQEKNPEALHQRQKMDNILAQYPEIAKNWYWLGEQRDIPELLANCTALVHVSLYEGLPNSICEAFISGCPVIASNVCDHSRLIGDNERGLLCDPLSAESICDALEQFQALDGEQQQTMRQNARCYAKKYLNIEKMVSTYEELILSFK